MVHFVLEPTYTGEIELYYRYPVAGSDFTGTVIHELVHYYASRWVKFKASPEESEVVAFGLSTKYVSPEEKQFYGFGIFNEAITEIITRRLFRGRPDYQEESSAVYGRERRILRRLYRLIECAQNQQSVTLFNDDGTPFEFFVEDWRHDEIEDAFILAAIGPRYSNRNDIPPEVKKALTNRRRNWARLMVCGLGKDLQKVAYLARQREQDESDDSYERRLNTLGELINELLARVDPEYQPNSGNYFLKLVYATS